MLIDNVTIKVKAGNGGDGKAAFNSNMMSLGPVGGNGGNGGDVYCEGVSDLSALAQFRNKKEVKTENGGNGRGQSVDGTDGKDLILKIPVGTVITNVETGLAREIVKIGERILIAHGGRGGIGNFKFRSATNTSPKQFTKGKAGDVFAISFELKLIADVGLVGLPNAGKSSLLNELTNAKSKVANYPFTTLEPSLGVYYELILADIPGLIEGASAGKGLGIKFLKHIERTKIIFHLISAESDNPSADYTVIRKELGYYSQALAGKSEHIFLTKSDLVSEEDLKNKLDALKKINKNAVAISIHDEASMVGVKEILNKIKSERL
ncbi:MAG: GTPase ObgE [Candidatus Yanofskybacteria bacterium]|nr:GTPase ObgE [Candidatus Yanofskybacteria bacterium]